VLLLIAATLVVIIGLGAAGFYFFVIRPDQEDQPPGSEAAQPYVERYVQLLNAGDEKGLRELLGDLSAPDDAARRIAAYRGLGLRDVHATVRYGPETRGDFPWFVTVKARTSADAIVTMQEYIDWTFQPSPHLAMEALSDMDGYLVGKWRVKGSKGDGFMRVRWTGGSSYVVDFGRFFDAPRKFVSVDSSWKTGGDPPGVIRYVTETRWSIPDAILLDLLADSVTITDGRSGKTASLVAVPQ
jgi:hypothetical protein